ncbi:MAG TPA: hypothetical protein VL326_29465 [Kofleriaceae bacterium]|jgi:hypothetical protein|nr:hypothetical protein [Kofleriaceae bacterium]
MKRSLIIAFAVLCFASNAYAQLSKEACVDAHSRGQDAREQGKISLARKLFLTCAQNGCPAAVQGDCARFADDLTTLQPTIVFVARDGDGNDLPETTVYVDGALIVTTLDGKPHDIDPGNHVVKFSNGGKDQVVTVVIGSGEKGRTVNAKFGDPTPAKPAMTGAPMTTTTAPAKPAAPKTTHPKAAMPIAIGGAVLTAAGAGVYIWGRSQVPDQCDYGTRQCAAPPGDPVFKDASNAASKANMGLVVGGVGAAALVGGVVWYFAGSKTEKESATQQAIAPYVNSNGAGIAVLGRF